MAIRRARWWPARRAAAALPGAGLFRAEPVTAAPDRPSRRQATALLATLVVVGAAVGVASYAVTPETARTFDLVHGSVFLTDQVAPVGIDLASGRPTLRLVGADKQVGAASPADITLVPVTGGTLMVDRHSGQFNMVDATGFVIKHDGGGVLLPRRRDTTSATAVAADGGPEAGVPGAAYIVRTGPNGTDVLLVNQSTVEVASNGRRAVQPRAQLTVRDQAPSDAGAVAAADGALWALFGTGADHQVREFEVPPRSDTGSQLQSRVRGSVSGAAAIGTATLHADGTGGTAVAVASAGRLLYFPADGSTPQVTALPDLPGLDRIMPVGGARGRFLFLEHSSAGWAELSLAADGTGLRGPTPVTGLPGSAQPAPPVASGGAVYTVDRAPGALGALYRVDDRAAAAPVRGAATYPLARQDGRTAETTDFSDAYVVADGSRVFVNSPSHTRAVALFTDGSRGPLLIRKSSAVDVSAAGGAEALTRDNIDPSNEQGNVPHGRTTKPTAGTQINNQVDCANTLQKPRVPLLTAPSPPGSRTVALSWSYPTLDPQDCIPSTYVVTVKALSANAPSSGGQVRVQGQTGVTVTGLYPLTDYSITVTAYLHGEGTASRPIRVRTGAEGPAAPTGLQVRADSSGNWVLDWDGCGSVGDGCLPVATWRVVPSVCDGQGVSAPPADLPVTADASSRAQPETVYHGGAALLGRGLSFTVLGVGQQGQTGAASASSPCVYSWRPPDASAITVAASAPADPSADGTTSVTASVRFADSADTDLGGVGGTLTYQLLTTGGGLVDTVGPTTDSTVQLNGVAAGRSYVVQVSASPPRHPDVVVPVGTAAVQPAIAPWPTVGVTTSFDSDTATTGTLHVSVDLGSTSAHGEHFDLVNSSLTCGSTAYKLDRTDVTLGQRLDYTGIDRFQYNGDCTVAVQLEQNAQNSTDPPVFGAGPSGVTTRDVSVPASGPTTTPSDFSAQWGADPDHPSVTVTYSGQDPEALMTGWTLTVGNGDTADCGTSNSAPTTTIDVAPSCVTAHGPFSVSIDYSYLVSKPHLDVPVTGTVPAPMDPTQISFSAAWGGDATTPTVDVTYEGTEDKSRLSAATWTETVTSPAYAGVTCGSDTKNPGFQVVSVPVDLTACPPGDVGGAHVTYTITISFTDVYKQSASYQPPIDGDPPT